MMMNVSQNNGWISGAVQAHVNPPHIPLIKSNIDTKFERDYKKTNRRRNPTSKTYSRYEFKTTLFDLGDPEEFILFQCNYQMILKVLGNIAMGEKIQYPHNFIHQQALCVFGTLCGKVDKSNTMHLNQIILILGSYFV